ncbi:MAG TPA: tetratricopeptide repeat protein, partial [Bacteroidales bacterium]|nr:tetratricopeptide repeat protein [Bacteroidales bacterium]
ALLLDKNHSLAYLARGMANHALKRNSAALSDLNKAIHLNIFYTEGYVKRGTIKYDSTDYEGALEDFNTAIKLDSKNPMVYFSRALTYLKLERKQEALFDFDKVLELDPLNSLTLYNRALMRTQEGQFKEALADYNKVVQLNPDNVLVAFNRAVLRHEMKDYKGAIADYSRAIELFPDFARAYLNRSDAWHRLGNEKNAFVDNEKGKSIMKNISQNADSTFSKYADSSFLSRVVEFEADFRNTSAVDGHIQYQPVYVDLERNFYITYLYNDSVYIEQKRNSPWQKWINDFNQKNGYKLNFGLSNNSNLIPVDQVGRYIGSMDSTLRISENDPVGYFFVGVLNGMVRNYNSAIEAYNQAISLNRDFAFAYLNRANTRLQQLEESSDGDDFLNSVTIGGSKTSHDITPSDEVDYSPILKDYDKVIDLKPDLAIAWFNRGNVKARMGAYNDAVQDYDKALELEERLGEAHFNRALLLIYLKRNEEACKDLSRAGELGIRNSYNLIKRYCEEE